MSLTSGFDLLSLFKNKTKILSEIDEDFKKYPDLRKVDIYYKNAIVNDNQIQFDDMMQFKYVFGKFDEKTNSPLGSFQDKRVIIDHIPGHVIMKFTSMDKLLNKPKNQKNKATIKIETSDQIEETTISFSKVGKHIRKYIDLYRSQYSQLSDYNVLNSRGIFDIENDIPPIVGFISGISSDNLDYSYPYRDNENPQSLLRSLKFKKRSDIEQTIKDRDNSLYRPIWKAKSRDLHNIEHKLMDHLKPLYKYCSPMFGDQYHIIEHNGNKLKVTYRIKNVDGFKEELNNLKDTLSDYYQIVSVDIDQREMVCWGVLNFKYSASE